MGPGAASSRIWRCAPCRAPPSWAPAADVANLRQTSGAGHWAAMSDCIFCAIVRGESPASLTHEDDTVIAFMDIQPITHGHMLVVPREHAVLMGDLNETVAMPAFKVARRLPPLSPPQLRPTVLTAPPL